jgi:hypothetical protein
LLKLLVSVTFYANPDPRSYTICTSPVNKENTPCSTQHPRSLSPRLHTKTSTL